MKGTIARLFVGLSLMALLAAPMAILNAAQGTSRNEVEPNDKKEQAEVIALAPGESLTINGKVKRGDKSTYVEHLESSDPFSANDPQEDWFAVDATGPLELGGNLSWTPFVSAKPDVDSWAFTGITEDIWSDGLVHVDEAATEGNPEVYSPNRIYYPVSDRADEVAGEATAPPETSRYWFTVSFYDPVPAPEATYKFTLRRPAPGSTRPALHLAHGVGPWYIVKPDNFSTKPNTLRAMTRITPAEYPARLDDVSTLLFGAASIDPPKVGDELTLIVVVDPQGTGSPNNGQEVLKRTVKIQELDAQYGVFNTYSLLDANIVVRSGDIYVGFEVDKRKNKAHLCFDGDRAGYYRSPISLNAGQYSGGIVFDSEQAAVPIIHNAGIDATLTINPVLGKVASGQRAATRTTSQRAIGSPKSVGVSPF